MHSRDTNKKHFRHIDTLNPHEINERFTFNLLLFLYLLSF